jgi:hypothetical protein
LGATQTYSTIVPDGTRNFNAGYASALAYILPVVMMGICRSSSGA